MKMILKDDRRYVLRFDRGEEVITSLQKFAQEENIKAATFSAIGAASEIIISWFDPEGKQYHDHALTKKLEIAALNGNIALLENQPIVHAHGSFSDVELHSRSGHVKKLIVSATCEVSLVVLSGEINRVLDPETGLNLMQ